MIYSLITLSHLFPEDCCLEVGYCCQLYVSLIYFFNRADKLNVAIAFYSFFLLWWAVLTEEGCREYQSVEQIGCNLSYRFPQASQKRYVFLLFTSKVASCRWAQGYWSPQLTSFARNEEMCCAIISVLGVSSVSDTMSVIYKRCKLKQLQQNVDIHILGWNLIL